MTEIHSLDINVTVKIPLDGLVGESPGEVVENFVNWLKNEVDEEVEGSKVVLNHHGNDFIV